MTAVADPQTDVRTRAAVTAAIDARAVSKSFRVDGQELAVLHHNTLSVLPGEMVAVMGPSGSGKSTLMYCLAGLEQPTEGDVWLAGTHLGQLSRSRLAQMRRSEVGFVFQSYNLIPTLSAHDNVALPYLLDGRRPPADLVEQVLAEVGLSHRRDALPPSMSGGEQQRTALARVLAQRPRIVFADEPTGALDSRSGEMVMTRLAEVAHDPERAVLLVTHDPAVAARCDRVLFLKDGRIEVELRPTGTAQVAQTLAALTSTEEG